MWCISNIPEFFTNIFPAVTFRLLYVQFTNFGSIHYSSLNILRLHFLHSLVEKVMFFFSHLYCSILSNILYIGFLCFFVIFSSLHFPSPVISCHCSLILFFQICFPLRHLSLLLYTAPACKLKILVSNAMLPLYCPLALRTREVEWMLLP